MYHYLDAYTAVLYANEQKNMRGMTLQPAGRLQNVIHGNRKFTQLAFCCFWQTVTVWPSSFLLRNPAH